MERQAARKVARATAALAVQQAQEAVVLAAQEASLHAANATSAAMANAAAVLAAASAVAAVASEGGSAEGDVGIREMTSTAIVAVFDLTVDDQEMSMTDREEMLAFAESVEKMDAEYEARNGPEEVSCPWQGAREPWVAVTPVGSDSEA